jgi:hypothetical protein
MMKTVAYAKLFPFFNELYKMKWSNSIISVMISSALQIQRRMFILFYMCFVILVYLIPFTVLIFGKIIRLLLQGNRREVRLLGILSFIHSTVWKVLFGKVLCSAYECLSDSYSISEWSDAIFCIH